MAGFELWHAPRDAVDDDDFPAPRLLAGVTVQRVAQWGDVSLWQALAAPLILSIVVAVAEELLVGRGDQTLNSE